MKKKTVKQLLALALASMVTLTACGQNVPKRIMPLKEAFMAPYEELFLNEAVGRAVSEFINLYPPGIPLLAPGECLDTECLNMIKKYYEKGYIVQGIHVKNCNNEIKINVVK